MKQKKLYRNEYRDVVASIASFKESPLPLVMDHLKQNFSHINEKTLWSIHNTSYKNRMKKRTPLLKSESAFIHEIYIPYCEQGAEDYTTLLHISQQVDISPALVAKRLLEYMLTIQPVTTQSVTTQPETTQPVTTQPVDTQSVTTQPVTTQPVTTQPVTTQPVTTQPVTTQPVTTQPVDTQSVDTQSVTTHLTSTSQLLNCSDSTECTSAELHGPSTVQQETCEVNATPISSFPVAAEKGFDPPNPTPFDSVLPMVDGVQGGGQRVDGSSVSSLCLLNQYLLLNQMTASWEVGLAPTHSLFTAQISVYTGKHCQKFEGSGRSKTAAKEEVAVSALIYFLPSITDDLQRSQIESHIIEGQRRSSNAADYRHPTLTVTPKNTSFTGKKAINELLRKPHNIPDPVLAKNVELCVAVDDQYGPIAMALHASLGSEYEFLLLQLVKKHKLHFKDESTLRSQGYDKTPDIKLDVPVAVNGQVINWIESKAMFGDEETHARYLDDQLWSYWNRFGPGMVIYWFGYVTEMENMSEGILLAHSFPHNLETLHSCSSS